MSGWDISRYKTLKPIARCRSSRPSIALTSLHGPCHGQSGTEPTTPVAHAPRAIVLDVGDEHIFNSINVGAVSTSAMAQSFSWDPHEALYCLDARRAHSRDATECAHQSFEQWQGKHGSREIATVTVGAQRLKCWQRQLLL